MANGTFNLKARAHQAMLDQGFHPDVPPEVINEISGLKQKLVAANSSKVADMRSLLWSSIDNDTSRDLDQVEYAERHPSGGIRLLVGIADVDCAVVKGSITDQRAAAETTSVYLGVTIYPMLPNELSDGFDFIAWGHGPDGDDH